MMIFKKTISYTLSIFLILTLLLVACNNDDDVLPPGIPGAITAEVEGDAWSSITAFATRSNSQFIITGESAEEEILTMTLDQVVVGSYELKEGSMSVGTFSEGPNTSDFSSSFTFNGLGQVTITEINESEKWVSGNFNFTATQDFGTETVKINDGQFTKIPFGDTTIIIPNVNSFSMTVDSMDWGTPSSVFGAEALGMLQISATNAADTTSAGLTFPSDITAGDYTLDWTTDYIGQYNIGTTVLMSSTSGMLTISNHDTTANLIQGTFAFTAEEILGGQSAEITDGAFSVSY